MITEQDLNSAILECQGQRNPNASTCIKLAAFLTIRKELFGETVTDPTPMEYSFAPYGHDDPTEKIIFDSGSEFSDAIYGKDQEDVFSIIDELMDVLKATNRRLYDGVMRKLQQ